MKCVFCGDNFYVKRGILDLFKSEKEYICNHCYKKYELSLKPERVILDKYEAFIITLFQKNYHIDYDYYYREYSKVFMSYFRRKGVTAFFFDSISFDDDALEELDCLSKLSEGNIVIIALYEKK